MTVLYHENFDGLSDGIPSGWSTILGVGMYSGAASVWTRTAVSGTRVIGRNSDGDSAVYSTTGVLTDQAIRTAQKWVSHSAPSVVESLLRNKTTSAYEGYRLLIASNGSSAITGKIYLYQGTHTLLATAAAAVPIAIGDVLHTEFKVVGTAIEGRLWINSDARPSAATVSVTNSVIASGYTGLRVGYSNGWSVADDVVITDGAGGEDYFYPGSSAATATTLSGPSSGTTGVASTNFTVGANGTITGTVTVTPGDAANGGAFTPTSVAISSGTPTATFTYTPASTGVKTISISDDGGLTDATPLSYTSNAASDTTAPTLTSPTGTQTGSTTASGTVSTNEANGTLYFLASTNATETAATVKAASSQTVTASGAQAVSFTGLTASTTYYAHYCHRDAAGNDSTVANSASFTTDAAASTYAPHIYTPRSGMGVNFYGAR